MMPGAQQASTSPAMPSPVRIPSPDDPDLHQGEVSGVDLVMRELGAVRIGEIGVHHVLAHVILDQSVHQSQNRATNSCDLVKDSRTSCVIGYRAFDCRHLPRDPADAGQKLILVGVSMCHRV